MQSILIPDFSSDSINVKSIISTADSPGVEYTGNISFISKGQNFHLEYIPNSARIFSDVFGPEGRVLTDDVINNWALVGYDNLNGIISNDENCISIVTVNVKVVFDVQFEIEHMVRREGDDKWVQSVEANIGDNIEFLIFYTNTSDSTQNNVVLKDILPRNMQYNLNRDLVKYNANHIQGVIEATYENGAIVGSGINIGNYAADSKAYVIFSATIVDDNLVEGTTKVVSWAQCGVGEVTYQDSASVFVIK